MLMSGGGGGGAAKRLLAPSVWRTIMTSKQTATHLILSGLSVNDPGRSGSQTNFLEGSLSGTGAWCAEDFDRERFCVLGL